MSLKVVIADDSSFFREVLREVLEADGDIKVVGEAADGAQAVRLVERERADVVCMDIQMPGTGGLEAIEELMARQPLPILVLTSQPAGPGSELVFEATRRGALDIFEKRVVANQPAWLREQVRGFAEVRVVRHPKALAVAAAARPGAPVSSRIPAGGRWVVGIGASAGGPPAVAAVLSGLPADFPAPIAVVQHLSPGFSQSYARFLQGTTALRVTVAGEAGALVPGTVLVAPDEHHLVASGEGFVLSDAPPEGGHRPSVDALLSSMAASFGKAAVGVVLSGMGSDGAGGLACLEAAGGLAIAQDEETAAIYGMPRAAARLAAGACVLALPDIAPALLRATSREPAR